MLLFSFSFLYSLSLCLTDGRILTSNVKQRENTNEKKEENEEQHDKSYRLAWDRNNYPERKRETFP